MEEIDLLEDMRGMIWILVHWLLPAKATKADAIGLIEKAYEERNTGLEIAEREDWLCGDARCAWMLLSATR